MNKNEILFDRRVVESNLREGIITPADYEKFKKSLPDATEAAQWVAIEQLAPKAYLKAVLVPSAEPQNPDSENEDEN